MGTTSGNLAVDPSAEDSGANSGVNYCRGYRFRELLIKQGRIYGMSSQGEGDAKLDIERSWSSARTGGIRASRSLPAAAAKETANGRIFYSRTTAICC